MNLRHRVLGALCAITLATVTLLNAGAAQANSSANDSSSPPPNSSASVSSGASTTGAPVSSAISSPALTNALSLDPYNGHAPVVNVSAESVDPTLDAYIAQVAYGPNPNDPASVPQVIEPIAPDGVSLRLFPYPFKAMLAIESDADHMTLRKFNIVHEFLNTKAETPLGRGLGLDVSDSFFMYNGSNIPAVIDYQGQTLHDEMTFFKGTSHQLNDGAIILHYIKAGWIDTFHSVGDFSRVNQHTTVFKRSQTAYAMAYLERHGVHITIFTDHGNQSNVGNFGAYGIDAFEDYQQGDNPSSPYYVTDLLHHEGVRFVWPDLFSDRYSYPTMIFPIPLRDGRTMWGFWRFTGTLRIDRGHRLWRYDWTDLWNPSLLAQELTPARLNELVQTHGFTVIATHLEGNADKNPLSTSAVEALTRLAHMQDRGQILVARTSRLLQYNLVRQYLSYQTWVHSGTTFINVLSVNDPVDGAFVPTWQQMRGITFNVRSPGHTVLMIRGLRLPRNLRYVSAHTVGVKWYPPDTKNYAVWSTAELALQQSQRQADAGGTMNVLGLVRSDWWLGSLAILVIVFGTVWGLTRRRSRRKSRKGRR
ncbi:MAG: hypothetical protein OWU32_11705 [Firmicutes bacterium]|nr:hypothetical protein [Bacillota bacterium]